MISCMEQTIRTYIGQIDGKECRMFVLDQDALDNEKMFKLQRSKSGHQGRLTELNNKISVLLFDAKNEDAVKELVKLSNRQ